MFTHTSVETNGIHLHVVEHGVGPAVLFCHGFPETWRSWRRQIETIAAAGYRCIAPDMRGYGGSAAPNLASAYTQLHVVGDLIGVLDALGVAQASLVGHDWGAATAWNAALLRPDRFPCIAALSVPYVPRGKISLLDAVRKSGSDFYMLRFQDDNADLALRSNVARTLRNIYFSASGGAKGAARWNPFAPHAAPVLPPSESLPSWLDQDDFDHAVATFQRTGFRGGLNWYRAIDLTFELMAPFKGARIMQPSLFMAGGNDPVLDFSRSGVDRLETAVPGLTQKIVLDGIGHWIQQEAAEAVNVALLDFLTRHGRR